MFTGFVRNRSWVLVAHDLLHSLMHPNLGEEQAFWLYKLAMP